MSTQLVAIAREFAFPSPSGLCLYLHTTINGVTMTPRISDESWQLLWGHLFEPRSPTLPPMQVPIGGKIEFDIDFAKARWYESWIGIGRRDHMDVPVSVTPSRPESLAHWRQDSRTSLVDDQTETPDESLDTLHLGRALRAPGQKHIPRKLSLLDRLESASVRSGSRLVPRNASPPSPSGQAADGRHPLSLSPIIQGDTEPPTARKDIDNFVQSWRVGATLAASPLAATGQTSLDPANLPNDMPIVDPHSTDVDAYAELNLEDFQWSVTSLGPEDYDDDVDDLNSLESWRIPSVHLDRRLEGSVCLTPTTCTSFGPPDWDADYQSYVSVISRLPSPDLAARMIEDCPPTPSTATSWGPPLSYPPSPSVVSRAPSVDVGQRCMSAVPLTPSTATTWGPPLSWPTTPATPYHVDTPDVAQRSFQLEVPMRRYPRPAPTQTEGETEPWRSVWPYNSVSTPGAEGGASSPYSFVFPRRPTSPEPSAAANEQAVDRDASANDQPAAGPSSMVWPYYSAYNEANEVVQEAQDITVPAEEPSRPFALVWPYYNAHSAEESAPAVEAEDPVTLAETIRAVSPAPEAAHPYALAWPYYTASHNDDAVRAVDVPQSQPTRVRKVSPFRFVFPTDDEPVASSSSGALQVPTEAPRLISPATPPTPWHEVWPLYGHKFTALDEHPVVISSVKYPYFNLCKSAVVNQKTVLIMMCVRRPGCISLPRYLPRGARCARNQSCRVPRCEGRAAGHVSHFESM